MQNKHPTLLTMREKSFKQSEKKTFNGLLLMKRDSLFCHRPFKSPNSYVDNSSISFALIIKGIGPLSASLLITMGNVATKAPLHETSSGLVLLQTMSMEF